MVIPTHTILGTYDVTVIPMVDSQVLHFTVSNPDPQAHLHQNSMVVSGAVSITTGEDYSTTILAGQSAKFTPRAGQSPFPAGTVSTLTAVGPTIYACVFDINHNALSYTAHVMEGPYNPPVGAIIIPTAECLINGTTKRAGTPILTVVNDVLVAEQGVVIGVFTTT